MPAKLQPVPSVSTKTKEQHSMQVPEGYRPLERHAPFWQLAGPFYEKQSDGGRYVGLRVQEKHGNIRNHAHGGVIATLADIALGYNIGLATDWEQPVVTVNLSV